MIHFSKIRWKNLLSTGSAFTEILLDKSPNTVIVGDNGAGKSTILDALCFALFGKPFRKIKKDQLVNTINGRDMLVELEFTFGGKDARVVRGAKPNKFEIYVDGQLIDQTASAKDYQDYLERNVLRMNMKTFTQVVILGSSSFVPFMQLPAGIRREVIEDLLDIQLFSLMSSLLKDKIQANDYALYTSSESIKTLERMIDTERSRARHEEDAISHKLSDLREKEATAAALVTENEERVSTIEAEVLRLSESSSSESVRKKLSRMDELLSDLTKKTRRVEKRRDFFRDNDECLTCSQAISDDFKKSKIVEADAELVKLDKASTDLSDMRAGLLSELNSLKALADEMARCSRIANEARQELGIRRTDLSHIRKQIDEIQNRESTFSRDNLENLVRELDKARVDREVLLKKQSMYSTASMMLRDGGIKAKIIRQYIPIINQLVNKYLAAMDFFVKFELNETFEERILSRHRDDFTYDSFSEGEKMRIDLALLFTWRSIARAKNSISTNILILDEVFDASLDGAGCDEFLKLIHTLENTNVFVISHKGDVLIDKFRSQIKFEKSGNYSRMV